MGNSHTHASSYLPEALLWLTAWASGDLASLLTNSTRLSSILEADTCREVCAEEASARRAAADVDTSSASAWQQLAVTSLLGSHEQWRLKRAMLSWTLATELRQVRQLCVLT